MSEIWNLISDYPISEFWAGRKGRMTPNQHGPLMSWATHVVQSSLQRVATG